jgi:hypothetical protein
LRNGRRRLVLLIDDQRAYQSAYTAHSIEDAGPTGARVIHV